MRLPKRNRTIHRHKATRFCSFLHQKMALDLLNYYRTVDQVPGRGQMESQNREMPHRLVPKGCSSG